MACCGDEDNTATTLGAVNGKIFSWLDSISRGSLWSESSDEEDNEDRQNVIVSVLFLLHVCVVFFFLAHHCTPRGIAQPRVNYH